MENVSHLLVSNDSYVAVSASDNGEIVFWDCYLEAVELHRDNLFSDPTRCQLLGIELLPLQENSTLSVEKVDKWAQNITADIVVTVNDQGLYPGAQGIVLDVLDDNQVCVLVSGLEEIVTFSVKHLKIVPPKVNEHVKIVHGEEWEIEKTHLLTLFKKAI